jgi:hypothetical protein
MTTPSRRVDFRIEEDLYFHTVQIMRERKFKDISATIRHILIFYLMQYYLENNMNKRIKKEQKIENMFFSKYLTKKMMRNAGKIKAAVKA